RLHLPVYHHRHVEKQIDLVGILDNDAERVKFLNSRVSGGGGGGGENGLVVGSKAVGVPLSPGSSLGVGNYYTKIGIGTPASYQYVLVDTGSSFSWLQCQPCAIYCHPQV
ncbi:hypothetical protein M569_08269, partial [Genlisea aurea]